MPRIAGHISAPPMPISARHAISQVSVLGGAAEQRERGEDRPRRGRRRGAARTCRRAGRR